MSDGEQLTLGVEQRSHLRLSTSSTCLLTYVVGHSAHDALIPNRLHM